MGQNTRQEYSDVGLIGNGKPLLFSKITHTGRQMLSFVPAAQTQRNRTPNCCHNNVNPLGLQDIISLCQPINILGRLVETHLAQVQESKVAIPVNSIVKAAALDARRQQCRRELFAAGFEQTHSVVVTNTVSQVNKLLGLDRTVCTLELSQCPPNSPAAHERSSIGDKGLNQQGSVAILFGDRDCFSTGL